MGREQQLMTKAAKFIEINNIEVRPYATDGLWCAFLLPSCIFIAAVKNSSSLASNYKLWSILSFGLLIMSLLLYNDIKKGNVTKAFSILKITTAISSAVLFRVCLHSGYIFSFYSGLMCTIFYYGLYTDILKRFPKCFSLGEAAIISQGVLLYLYSVTKNIYDSSFVPLQTPMQISSLIAQIGLLGVGLVFIIMQSFRITNFMIFYFVAGMAMTFVVIIPLHILLAQSPLLWIIKYILKDVTTITLILYWAICVILGSITVSRQIWNAKRASSSLRKVFHILLFIVCIPGLLMRCTLLYLATGIVLGIFIALELLRVHNMPPFGLYLQDGYAVFRDEKDKGVIALTPLYLLIGCAVPLWIHPSPCDVTDSTTFTFLPLLSGLLVVGIGDSAASVVGTFYGIHKWKGTSKSIEGTTAYILSQLGVILLLIQSGYLDQLKIEHYIRLIAGVTVTSLVEAKSTQIDNLTLPLIMFIFLI